MRQKYIPVARPSEKYQQLITARMNGNGKVNKHKYENGKLNVTTS